MDELLARLRAALAARRAAPTRQPSSTTRRLHHRPRGEAGAARRRRGPPHADRVAPRRGARPQRREARHAAPAAPGGVGPGVRATRRTTCACTWRRSGASSSPTRAPPLLHHRARHGLPVRTRRCPVTDPDAIPLSRGRRAAGYLVATVGTGLSGPVPLRDDVDALSMGWAFLALVVLAAARRWARARHHRVDRGVRGVQLLLLPALRDVPGGGARARRRAARVPRALGARSRSLLAARAGPRRGGRGARATSSGCSRTSRRPWSTPARGERRHARRAAARSPRLGLGGVDLYVTGPRGAGSGLELRARRRTAPTGPAPDDVGLERFPLMVGRRPSGCSSPRGAPAALAGRTTDILTAFGNQLALRARARPAAAGERRGPAAATTCRSG